MVEPYRIAAFILGVEIIVTSGDVAKHQGPLVVGYEQAIDALAY